MDRQRRQFLQLSYTGWAKKVIPLLIILHCTSTRGITFLAHPVRALRHIRPRLTLDAA